MIKIIAIFLLLLTSVLTGKSKVIDPVSQPELNTDNLPLIVKPGLQSTHGPVFYLISGDGGWNNFDNSFTEGLAQKGIPVVGLDSKKYFWTAKSPEETTRIFENIIAAYNKKFDRDSFVIAGYSFGADLVPFIINGISPDIRKKLSKVILMSPDRFGDFEIHLSDMLNLGISKRKYNVVEGVKKTSFTTTTCIFGKNEETVNINAFRGTGSDIVILPGDHHYNNNYQLLDETLLRIILHTPGK